MASRSSPLVSSILRQLRAQSPRTSLSRAHLLASPRTRLPSPFIANTIAIRAAHSIPRPPPGATASSEPQSQEASSEASTSSEEGAKSEGKRPPMKADYYQLSFTCLPCGHRSHHNVSKQGYHHGSTLITCPECRNRHVISDHLNIFGDRKVTIEDIMREKGQLVKRGNLGEDGDIEFWPDERYAEQVIDPARDQSS
ncbi:DNL zinc finger-domain-containing protein [Thelonectria olida]|uniref:DNL zinc finger-domain-containing protein n=1 Tax=Thelonectria olida TaxID=1576542 RepID=A0A9P8WIK9_9HYPO|nr:DNL zinc finger-domain-containing protein [Thelonectria olida]